MIELRIKHDLLMLLPLLNMDFNRMTMFSEINKDIFEEAIGSDLQCKNLARLSDFRHIQPTTEEKEQQYYQTVNEMVNYVANPIFTDVMQNITLLSNYMSSLCGRPENDFIMREALIQGYMCLRHMEEQHQEVINGTLESVKTAYEMGTLGYQKKDFAAIGTMFGIPEDKDVVINCFLAPRILKNGTADGVAINGICFQFYRLTLNEQDTKESDYLEGTNSRILKRKLATPFHEGIHVLLNESPLKQQLYDMMSDQSGKMASSNPTEFPQMQQFMKKILFCVSDNREDCIQRKHRDTMSENVVFEALSEAFAASGSSYARQNIGEKLPSSDKDWYAGWFFASKLCKHVYPVFVDYLKAAKPIDDTFFKRLNEDKALIAYLENPKLSCAMLPNNRTGNSY